MRKIVITVFLGICLYVGVYNLSAHPREGYSSGVDSFPSFTEAELKVSTPTVVGTPYYDTTNKAAVISTGTTNSGDYGQINAGTTKPGGW